MNTAARSTILLCSAALLAACSSTPIPPSTTAQASAAATTSSASKQATASSVATVSIPEHLDPKSAISRERSVYFAFDDYSTSKYTDLIARHGKYLAAHPSLAIKIEGNADERGGTEYNLALGQKRAEAVMHALQIYGVKDSRMEAISWGKEKPRATGHDEASWAQNRRADLVYPQK